MKPINKYLIIFLSLFLFAACDFMDCNESDYYSKEQIQGSYARVKQFVTNVYSYLPQDFCSIDGAMQDAATDDAIHVYKTSNVQRFVNGTWSANTTIDDKFSNYYSGIHDANFYLENMVGLTFEDWKYGDEYEDWMKEYPNYEYEIRFLRAFFYFELVKRYKNIPLITKVVTKEEANNAEPVAAGVILDFIISECTEMAQLLPVSYTNFGKEQETGRVTKGVALALKARAALYAASPLFNPDNDKSKWIAAAEAAYEIIGNQSALGYTLDKNFANLFGTQNNRSQEVIWARPNGENNGFEASNFPMGVTGGKTSTCPTENLASAFEMNNGEPFDWTNEAMRENPYAQRDPRFYLTIVHNSMKWPADKEVEIWEGGSNGLPLTNATTTGYYLRKYVNSSISFEAGAPTTKAHHNWILFRYAEVLLNYAEAMVNAYDDITFTNEKCGMSALQAVNQVRSRDGVKMPALSETLSPAVFLKRLKNERRVELAFEGHRFWDLRRWKELDALKDIYGVKITKEESGINYTRQLLDTRLVDDKLYFYPIANTELFKNDKLKQNPGWD